MFNFATGKDLEAVRQLKALYKSVLADLVVLLEQGGFRELPAVVTSFYDGRRREWTLQREPASPCSSCGCDRFRYVPSSSGIPFAFCPFCWRLQGNDSTGGGSVDVGAWLEKKLRDLPPGIRMSWETDKRTIPLGPREVEMTPAEEREALERYRAQARRPLEIGKQAWLGKVALDGLFATPRDYGEARSWYEKAALFGHAEALYALSLLAHYGLGEPRDEGRAATLCRQAALRGHAPAESGMGILYREGVGVPKDPVAAVAWWQRAAKKDDREAQLAIGRALIEGEGIERDEKAGLALVHKAAEAGLVDAQYYLGTLLADSTEPATAADGRELLAKAAGQGHDGAKRRLAAMNAPPEEAERPARDRSDDDGDEPEDDADSGDQQLLPGFDVVN